MPLRAVVDGREVQVWDLDGGEWADLRRRGRADAGAVAMACCGAPGLAKALSDRLKLPVQLANPIERIQVAEGVFDQRTQARSVSRSDCRTL